MDELQQLGKALAASGYFQDAETISKAIVKVLAGREMGFGPIAAMTGIHIIKGRPSIGANLMAAAVKAHPRYNYRVTAMGDDRVTIAFFEDGKPCGESMFTAQDATKAQTQNMNKFPRNMLFARAMSNGVRWFCPDVFMGNTVYTPDELGESVDDTGVVDVPSIVVEKPEAPPVVIVQPPKGLPADEITTEEAVTDWMDGQRDAPTTPMAETPAELPSKWPAFCTLVMRELRYEHMAHVLNAYKQEIGPGYELPYHTVGAQAGQMIDAAGTWAVLAGHKLKTDPDGIPF